MLNQQVSPIGKISNSNKNKNRIINKFRCGALHCGDQINAIDQKSFDGMSLMDANAILRSCTSDFCRIEVTPASAFASLNIIHESTQNRGLKKYSNIQIFLAFFFSIVTMNDNVSQTLYRPPIQMNNWTMRNNYQNLGRKSLAKTRHNSISKKPMICFCFFSI